MHKYDDLYEYLKSANEERERDNLNRFMESLESRIVEELNNAFLNKSQEEYQRLLTNVKNKGIRVFRDSEGKHKLKFI